MVKRTIEVVLLATIITLPMVAVNTKDEALVDTNFAYREQEIGEVVISGRKQVYAKKKLSSSLRLDQPIIQIPQNIHVVTRDMLNDLGIATADEGIQRTVSGVTKLEHWGDYIRVNARGSRVAAFREGMNFTSTWGPMTEDMSYVDRMEFVKGPAGFMALYF